jgi:hypothetical protein
MDGSWIARKLIGVACTALGLFALWASPFSTVSCTKGADGVTCQVKQAILGVVTLNGTEVRHVRRAEVSHSLPGPDPSRTSTDPTPNNTYQLAFITAEGRVAPRGVDASHSAPLDEIATEVNDLVSGDGGPFSERNYNGFPTVAGCIFFVLGVIIVLNG